MTNLGKTPSSNKVFKAGKVTRNPYLNFLREYRAKQSGKSLLQITKEGAEIWRKMDEKEKEPYFQQARTAPKSPRRWKHKRCGGRHGRHHSRSKSRSRSRGRSRNRNGGGRRHGKSCHKRHKSRKAGGGHRKRSRSRRVKIAGCGKAGHRRRRSAARKGRKGGKRGGDRSGRKKSRRRHASRCGGQR